ncbi:hypothetical protein AVEN_154830-1 [Araneus ventricosus]|uniref:Uncharacterized protein n=1 Tax=Araneus ventricosus TaxID=182803 RepID=A0A4Y2BTA4_ARAVE|nr:hypothetical protein AVEN_154830-1 [Araneus ventricosus]
MAILGKTYAKLKKVYREDCMTLTGIYKLFNCFQHGRENVENDDFQSIHKCQNQKDMRSSLLENQRITIRESYEECSITYNSVQSILTEDLSMRRIFTKFLPKFLSADKKRLAFSCARSL